MVHRCLLVDENIELPNSQICHDPDVTQFYSIMSCHPVTHIGLGPLCWSLYCCYFIHNLVIALIFINWDDGSLVCSVIKQFSDWCANCIALLMWCYCCGCCSMFYWIDLVHIYCKFCFKALMSMLTFMFVLFYDVNEVIWCLCSQLCIQTVMEFMMASMCCYYYW